ncbi:GDSL-type esterase/lipase family protein [Bacteroidota bacterium]
MPARFIRCFLIFICGLIWSFPVLSQSSEYPYTIPEYDFIHYDSNEFVFPGNSSSWQDFFAGFSRLIKKGEGQLSLVHIGGSHLQADIYSHRIRNRLQTFQPGINAGRGLIFPYSVAKTNNPSNFLVSYTGKWTSCKNTERNRICPLGLSGISVTTTDTSARIRISFPEQNIVPYDFNRIRIFSQEDSLSYDISIDTDSEILETETPGEGTRIWTLEHHVDNLEIILQKTAKSQQRFTLFGISLETDDPGLVYHSVGINGAKIPSFLRCSLLSDQLSDLSADMVILSLGTNDAYTRYFDPIAFKQRYDSLIRIIRYAVPGAGILLTVPNDSYLYRQYVNRNTARVREVIMELAKEHNCGVWDFYSIMGGLNSILVWQRFGLAKRDRIHFTRKGYLLKGDLFFNAFLKSYDEYLDRTNQPGPLN